MSSTKENFNKAVFEMFGVGSDPAAAEKSTPAPVKNIEKAPSAPVVQTAEPKVTPAAPVTYLAPGTVMEGNLSAKGDVEVAGEFKGNITTEGKVILHSDIHGNITAAELVMNACHLIGNIQVSGPVQVDTTSSVEGDVSASELICSGKIKGDLNVSGNTDLLNGAKVEGTITTGTIVIERGASVSGELHMGGKK